ncbi:MAG TPA: acetate--CoA ligase family protein [Pseudonocardiaceae bacterium]|nr:acetate--CoA ligase family protein [Pseudonocardiaceae bacterium]
MSELVKEFFTPTSIAIVGASPRPASVANRLTTSLLRGGYPGTLAFVTDRHAEIDGIRCVPRVRDLPEPPGLTLVCVPAAGVAEALRDIAAIGGRNAMVVGSGFAEAGAAGSVLEDELCRTIVDTRMTVLGPNCMGFMNCLDDVTASFASVVADGPLRKGSSAVLSQSGGVAGIAALRAARTGMGCSFVINSGNEAGLTTTDLLRMVVADGRSTGVFVYVEQLREGGRLLAAIREAREADVPVIVLHGGSEPAGAVSAGSHTGALAVDGRIARELLADAGAWVVTSPLEGIEALRYTSRAPVRATAAAPTGTAGLATSGGMAVLSADAIGRTGGRMAEFAPRTRERIAAILPDFATVTNPLDITASISFQPERVRELMAAVLGDPDVGSVLVCGANPLLASQRLAEAIAPVLAESPKLGAVAWFDGDDPVATSFREAAVPYFESVNEAAAFLATARPPRVRPPTRPAPTVAALTEDAVKSALAARGIDVPAGVVVAAGDDPDTAVAGLTGPFAVKGLHPTLVHKVAARVVETGVPPDRVADVVARIAGRMRDMGIEAPEVLVEPMVPPGTEVFLGLKVDPSFGPVAVFGLGGTGVESGGGHVIRSVPRDADRLDAEVARLVAGLVDDATLAATVSTVVGYWLAELAPKTLDVNPIILSAGRAWVVDAVALDEGGV